MAIEKHDTPMLDQLDGGPWPSFISGIKRLRDEHPEPRINEVTNDLLTEAPGVASERQLEELHIALREGVLEDLDAGPEDDA